MATYLIQDEQQSYLPFLFFTEEGMTPYLCTLEDVRNQVARGLSIIGLTRTLEPDVKWVVVSSVKNGLKVHKFCLNWQAGIIMMLQQAKAERRYSKDMEKALAAWGKWLVDQFGDKPIPVLRTDSVIPLAIVLSSKAPAYPKGSGVASA